MIKYFPKELIDKFLEKCPKELSEYDVFSQDFLPIKELAGEIYLRSYRIMRDKTIEYLSGKADNSEFINDCGNLKELIEDGLRQCKEDGTDHMRPELFYGYFVESKGSEIQKSRLNLTPQVSSKESYLNFSKDKIAQASESIKSQLVNKETLKGAGIGAAIVGGVALAGSLIYKAIKNKKAEQSK